jgi:hypothetical protein
MARLVIGCGTGRCGTMSLANLLDSQDNAWVTHELMQLPWKFNKFALHNVLVQMILTINPDELCIPPDKLKELVDDFNSETYDANLYRQLFEDREEDIIGDVSYWWINYVKELIGIFPDARFVCLQRDNFRFLPNITYPEGNL